ncbi:MAG: phosphoribosyl-ATP diphosphatase [Chloroflexi bacterium]|nr:phosphoribosyl-ATP diphosphatase [Chloroflexota bacterium]
MSEMFKQLEAIIRDRQRNPAAGSYTNRLLDAGRATIAQKVGEEAVETIVAALEQGRREQVSELADLFYHVLVLMAELDLSLQDVELELESRHRPRG